MEPTALIDHHHPNTNPNPVDRLCKQTCGESKVFKNYSELNIAMEQLASKLIDTVCIKFTSFNYNEENLIAVQQNEEISSFSMVYPITMKVSSATGYWPLAENFWVGSTGLKLQKRKSHLTCMVDTARAHVLNIPNRLPFDKYELDESIMSTELKKLINKTGNNMLGWYVYVMNSDSVDGPGHPIGMVKASSNGNCAHFYVLPYNFPYLFVLLDELLSLPDLSQVHHSLLPHSKWRIKFDHYTSLIPRYYIPPLVNALNLLKLKQNWQHLCPTINFDQVNAVLNKTLKEGHGTYRMKDAKLFSAGNSMSMKKTHKAWEKEFISNDSRNVCKWNLKDQYELLRKRVYKNEKIDSRCNALRIENEKISFREHYVDLSVMGDYQGNLDRLSNSTLRPFKSPEMKRRLVEVSEVGEANINDIAKVKRGNKPPLNKEFFKKESKAKEGLNNAWQRAMQRVNNN